LEYLSELDKTWSELIQTVNNIKRPTQWIK
jgi:hypothetical protein